MTKSTVVAQVIADVNPAISTASKGQRQSVSNQQPTGTPPTSQETMFNICHFSGDNSMAIAFRQLPQSGNGGATAVQGALIPYFPL